ncbi:MAG: TRAP transporter small permease subunit [Gammaproteobacteria bacterium]|nr:TRAP transporter small permease subunit [Gammaproteobacteria bacterium]
MTKSSLIFKFLFTVDSINRTVGQVTAWLVLFLVLIQFAGVILRYVFSIGSIQLQELIWYMHGTFFMLGIGYTLLKDRHVRLDVFYRDVSETSKALINLLGSVFLLIPFCIFIWWLSWPFVITSWAIQETSMEVSGLPFLFLFKTTILVFCILLGLQGITLAIKSFYRLRNFTS